MQELQLAHDLLNEQAVLGGLMTTTSEKYPAEVYEIVPEDFSDARHGKLFMALQELRDEKSSFDLVTAHGKLQDWGALGEVKAAYLVELANNAPLSMNLDIWCRRLLKLSRFRHTRGRVAEALDQSNQGSGADHLASSVMDAVRDMPVTTDLTPMKTVLGSVIKDLEYRHSNPNSLVGRSMGFLDLDAITGGLCPGDLFIIAARPSMGKTSLALDILRRAEQSGGESFLLFSAEMTKEAVGQRMLAAESRVPLGDLRTGRVTQSDFAKIAAATGRLAERSVHISDRVEHVDGLEAAARRYAASGVSLIVVDYLQLLTMKGKEASREREVSTISRRLKCLAKDLGVPIVVLAQLNRQVESRPDKRPQLSDLRESGSIEQDADICAFIYRDEYYNENSADRGLAEVRVAKNRNGPTGTKKLRWDAIHAKFENDAGSRRP